MLKNRIIACLPIFNGAVVQSIQFRKLLPIGKPAIIIDFLCRWGIDEIIVLDINASKNQSGPNWNLIKSISNLATVPLTYGGGITTAEQAKKAIAIGVDKISLNTALADIELLKEISDSLGAQSLIASIDLREKNDNYEIFNHVENRFLPFHPTNFFSSGQISRIGELLITSTSRYGMKSGYDHRLIKKFSVNSLLPIIALGGGYKPNHFIELFNSTGVSSFAIENSLFFKEHSVALYKSQLNNLMPLRFESLQDYKNIGFDDSDRIKVRPEQILEDLFYKKVEKRSL